MTDHDVESRTKKVEKLSDREDSTHPTAACDLDEAVQSHSTATFNNDNDGDNNRGKEQAVKSLSTKEASAGAKEPGNLGDAIAALDLTSYDDAEGDDVRKDEVITASVNIGAEEMPTKPTGTEDLGDASDQSAATEACSIGGAQNIGKNKKLSPRNSSDILVPLRPEGVFTAEESNGTRTHSKTSPNLRVRFDDEATLRGYERGSIPSPTFQASSSRASNQPVLRLSLNTTSDSGLVQTAELKDKLRLVECEEELDLLERSLPTKSRDPNSVKFTKVVIESARDAVRQAQRGLREDCEREELMDFALYVTIRAHGFHEETLRLVNGTDKTWNFREFERRMLHEDECREKLRSQHAGALPDDYFDDSPDA